MNWNLEGNRVNGLYMGLFPYSGLITESRVKYGGQVQHTIKVDEPFKVYGAVRETILVDVAEITRILDERDAMQEDHRYDDQYELDTDYN
jgi:hypothetical protein